jgi:hypothetical protein
MKKILALTLLLALVFSVFAFLPARAENDYNDDNNEEETRVIMSTSTASGVVVEKISSPDQIRYFRVIKKENGALYGIRLEKMEKAEKSEKSEKMEKAEKSEKKEANESLRKNENVSASNNRGELEKILAPQFIGLYERIQKVGNSLWGVKRNNDDKDEVKNAPKYREITAEMRVCVAAAIDVKDEALKARVTVTGTELNAAITARGECQKNAIASLENQRENLNVCVKNFQIKHKEIVNKAKEAQQAAWKTYQTSLKACLPNIVSTSTAEIMIEDGGSAALEAVSMQ